MARPKKHDEPLIPLNVKVPKGTHDALKRAAAKRKMFVRDVVIELISGMVAGDFAVPREAAADKPKKGKGK